MTQDELKIKGMHLKASPVVFKNAALLRNTMTKPEIMLWEYLRRKPFGYKFRGNTLFQPAFLTSIATAQDYQ